ncbi:ketopantoate reductase family protein [Heyndrickxia acidiproducens]|uniref:ketopantoate reductase family protein n=1 Tax=Heyndrickxia acidiproducens TaxID=1121084 RepID=UPI00036C24DF|nr:ketopantoate reductase family protein [Heyndrickxia acidiproducens]
MEIKTVSIIGLGALGVLFGRQLAKKMPEGDLRVIADRKRIERYERDGVYCNGDRCSFHYVTPEEECGPADLLIFAVKFNGLADAVQAVKKHVGPNTIILSALNGISSEEIISRTYGMDKILYCVAQGMDAVKTGNQLTYDHIGMLCFGEKEPGYVSEKAERVARFFEKTDFPYELDKHMMKRLWGKFMLNVGVNQTVAVFKSNFGEIQKEGPAREMMIAAMREVMALSEKEGFPLTEADLQYWLKVVGALSPDGKPSMAQDVEAKRYSEVGLFSGTVIELGKKHNVPVPVNEALYQRIQEMESGYENLNSKVAE